MRFGHREKGSWDDDLIHRVNPHSTDTDLGSVLDNVALSRRALRQSGFSQKEVTSPLVATALGYAANILLAQLRAAGLLPEERIVEQQQALSAAGDIIRERIGDSGSELIGEEEPLNESDQPLIGEQVPELT
jgi:hypothetical protein